MFRSLRAPSPAGVSQLVPRNSVGTAQLRSNAVTNLKVRNNAITSPKVRNRSLFAAGQVPAGPAGPAGLAGPPGAAGPTGPAGPFPDALPAGRTIRGAYNMGGTSDADEAPETVAHARQLVGHEPDVADEFDVLDL